MKNKIINFFFLAVTILCLIFLGRSIVNLDINWLILLEKDVLISFSVSSAIIILCIYVGAYLYRKNMELLTGKKIQHKVINSIYIKSNIGKYLPGNVFHFAGRNLLGKKFNLDQKALLGSTILLHMQTITLSLLLPLILDINVYKGIFALLKDFLGRVYFFAVGGLIISIILVFSLFRKQIAIQTKELLMHFTNKSIGKIIGNFFITGIYLILYGISFFIITYAVNKNGGDLSSAIVIIVSFILAWLCGLVIIGAPGGIGVREVVLLFLLRKMIPEAELLIIVVLHRFCTISADGLSFILELIKEKYLGKIDG